MATKFYLHNAATTVAGTLPASNASVSATSPSQIGDSGTNRSANKTIGAANPDTEISITTAANVNAQPSQIARFVSDRLSAQTISAQSMNISIGGTESAAQSNFQIRFVAALWRPSTGSLVGRMADLAANSTAEPGTTETSLTATLAANSTSQTAVDGDVIVFEVWRDSTVQANATGRTNTIAFDGATEASTTTNAAFINFATSNILFLGQGYGQAQASIKATSNAFAQAQADIKVTSNAFARANAQVIKVGQGFGQSQADIKATSNALAQANADILAKSNSYAQANADIEVTSNVFAQSQADILVKNNGFAQAQARINATSNAFGQAQADIKQTYNAFAQAQADIKQTSNGFAQAQASIKRTYNAFAQANADILATSKVFAQAQATILAKRFAQAQADIKQTYNGFAQAQADIKATSRGYGQSQADIKAISKGFAQAQADILVTTNRFAQSGATIKQTYNGFAQAQALIFTYVASAQAQAYVLSRYEQALLKIPGLQSYWPLDETGSTVYDRISSVHGTVQGSPLVGTDSPDQIGTGLNFNSNAANYVDFGDNYDFADNTSMTILLWRKGTGFKLDDPLLTKGTYTFSPQVYTSGWATYNEQSRPMLSRGSNWTPTSSTITTGIWQFIVLSWNSNNRNIWYFIDGALDNVIGYNETVLTDTSEHLLLGTDSHGVSSNGTVASVAIFNEYISPDDIQALSSIGQSGLVARPAQAAALIAAPDTPKFRPYYVDTFSRQIGDGIGASDGGETWQLTSRRNTYQEEEFYPNYFKVDNGKLQISYPFNFYGETNLSINNALFFIRNGIEISYDVSHNGPSSGGTALDIYGEFDLSSNDSDFNDIYLSFFEFWSNHGGLFFGDSFNDPDDLENPTSKIVQPNQIIHVKSQFIPTASHSYFMRQKAWYDGHDEPDWQRFRNNAQSFDRDSPYYLVLSLYTDEGNFTSREIFNSKNNVLQTVSIDNLVIQEAHMTQSGMAAATIVDTKPVGMALAEIANTTPPGMAQAWIMPTFAGFAQAAASINQAANTANALGRIKNTYRGYGQAQAIINQALQAAQSQADILATSNTFGQSQAFILRRFWPNAQANAQIIVFDVTQSAETQALIVTPDIQGYGQAQALYRYSQGDGQAQALIKFPGDFGQAQAQIIQSDHPEFGQAQASITDFTPAGQAQAYILLPPQSYAQAGAIINQSMHTSQAAATVAGYTRLRDTFTRDVPSGWGTPDEGPDWKRYEPVNPNDPTFNVLSVSGGKGVFLPLDSDDNYWGELISREISLKNIDVSFDYRNIPQSSPFAAGTYHDIGWFAVRGNWTFNGSYNYWQDYVVVNFWIEPNNGYPEIQWQIYSYRSSFGMPEYYEGNFGEAFEYDVDYRFRFKVLDNADSSRIFGYFKAWKINDPEPEWETVTLVNDGTGGNQIYSNGFETYTLPFGPQGAGGLDFYFEDDEVNLTHYDNFLIEEGIIGASAQAGAFIVQVNSQPAQAQADILVASNGHGQSQAEIKQTYNGFAQAQGTIRQTYQGYGQAQADIKATGYGFGQANADIKQTSNRFAQAQAQIKQTYNGYGQAQGSIRATYNGSGQAQADIKAVGYRFANAQADIRTTYNGYGQSNADIKATSNGYGQANADIRQTYNGFGQAQAKIEIPVQITAAYGQASADIKATSNGYGQSSADIRVTTNTFAQAQARIRQTYIVSANAQAYIKITQQGYAQAAASIKQTYTAFAQAQAQIKVTTNGYAQAQAQIKQTYQGYGQAAALILRTEQSYAQAQALIKITSSVSGQAQASILATSNVFGQAQTHIAVRNTIYAQAQAYILSGAAYGQAQAFIRIAHYLKTLDISDRESLHLSISDRVTIDETTDDTGTIGLVLTDRESPKLEQEDRLVIGLTVTDRNYGGE